MQPEHSGDPPVSTQSEPPAEKALVQADPAASGEDAALLKSLVDSGALGAVKDDAALLKSLVDSGALGADKNGPLLETIVAARILKLDATKWDFTQLLEANTTIRDFQARQTELETRAKADARLRVGQFVLALILVVGAVGGVFVGILSDFEPAEVAQFLAPITGLAGIAIGYIFGRSSE